MMDALGHRVAVVTGASAGIGEAIARELVRLGASVVVNARRAERVEKLADELGDAAVGCVGDAADPAVIGAMLELAKERFGREADLVVVNAGRGLNGSVLTSDTGEWEEMVRTNLMGAAHLMRAAGARMLKQLETEDWQKSAHDIVVIGSVVGRHVSPFSSMYGSTKFAANSLAEAMRREVGPKGIRVTLIEPAFVKSEFQGVAGYDPAWFKGVVERIGPVLEPEDIARSVGFVASQPARVHVSDVLVRPTRQDYP